MNQEEKLFFSWRGNNYQGNSIGHQGRYTQGLHETNMRQCQTSLTSDWLSTPVIEYNNMHFRNNADQGLKIECKAFFRFSTGLLYT